MLNFCYLFEGLASEPLMRTILRYGGVDGIGQQLMRRVAEGKFAFRAGDYGSNLGRTINDLRYRTSDLINKYGADNINEYVRQSNPTRHGNFDIEASLKNLPSYEQAQAFGSLDANVDAMRKFKAAHDEKIFTDPQLRPMILDRYRDAVDELNDLKKFHNKLGKEFAQYKHENPVGKNGLGLRQSYDQMVDQNRLLKAVIGVETIGGGAYGSKKLYDYVKNPETNPEPPVEEKNI